MDNRLIFLYHLSGAMRGRRRVGQRRVDMLSCQACRTLKVVGKSATGV
jgi:hypothetical protein